MFWVLHFKCGIQFCRSWQSCGYRFNLGLNPTPNIQGWGLKLIDPPSCSAVCSSHSCVFSCERGAICMCSVIDSLLIHLSVLVYRLFYVWSYQKVKMASNSTSFGLRARYLIDLSAFGHERHCTVNGDGLFFEPLIFIDTGLTKNTFIDKYFNPKS